MGIFKNNFFLLLFLILLSGHFALGQSYYYAGVGGNFSFLQSEGLNSVIDNYNANNTISGTPLKKIRFLGGPYLSVGAALVDGKLPLEIGWSAGFKKRTDEQSGTKVEVRNNMIMLGLGYNFLTDRVVRPGISGMFSIGTFKILASGESVINDFQAGIGPMINVQISKISSPVGASVRFFYQYNLTVSDFSRLDESINPYDYSTRIKSHNMLYGIQTLLTGQLWKKQKYRKKVE